MFYNPLANSVFCYGLLAYGSAAKTNFKKVESAHRRISTAIVFRAKQDSLKDALEQTKNSSVCRHHNVKLKKKLFDQLRREAPMRYFEKLNFPTSNFTTGWNLKGLFSSSYNRTVAEQKPLENTLQKIYKLNMVEIKTFNTWWDEPGQINSIIQKLAVWYVRVNQDLLSHFGFDYFEQSGSFQV